MVAHGYEPRHSHDELGLVKSHCRAWGLVIALVAFAVIGASSWTVAQSLLSPTYTTAQAALGRSAYAEHCASCHGDTLDGGQFGGPLRGVLFRQQWGG
jgi:mono/diheme cytochrome c family protein